MCIRDRCPIDIFLGTNFWNSEANKLYVYEVHVDDAGGPTVATLDLRAKEWTVAVSYAHLSLCPFIIPIIT